MNNTLTIATWVLLGLSTALRADAEEQEAIQAQLATAMASADYAARKCPRLRIDQAKIDSLMARSGKTAAQLRASEDYAEQRDVISALEQQQPARLLCALLPDAHGGYARGIITER